MAMDNVGGNVVQVLVAEGGALPDVIEDDGNALFQDTVDEGGGTV